MMNPMDCRLLFGYKTREPDDANAFAAPQAGSQCRASKEKLVEGSIAGEANPV
jgi:hypothetical protein